MGDERELLLYPSYFKHCPVKFPHFLRHVSPVVAELENKSVNDRIYVPYTSAFLNLFSRVIALLPPAARDTNGGHLTQDDINEETIFVNSLVKRVIKIEVFMESNQELGKLFRAAKYFEIKPLINAFASFIADRVSCSQMDLNEGLSRDGFGEISPELQKYIQKYIYFKELGIEELTISDYLGLYGQPDYNTFVRSHNLSNKGLTSLKGIDLISESHRPYSLFLEKNFILGADEDPDFPITGLREFKDLVELDLSSNEISSLPKELFKGLTELKFLSLSHNKISAFSEDFFKELPNIQQLSVNNNRIQSKKEEFIEYYNIATDVVSAF